MKELIEIQSRLRAPKSQYNNFGKYSYRSAEDILNALKPLLKENGCTLTISDEVLLIGNRFYVQATCTLKNASGETETTTALAREEDAKKGMDGSQITGTASSYARKYALNGLFAIDDTKDADALNTNAGYTQQPVVTPAAPAAPAATLSDALAEVASVKSSAELTAVWRKYARAFGKEDAFIEAVKTSPVNPKAAAAAING